MEENAKHHVFSWIALSHYLCLIEFPQQHVFFFDSPQQHVLIYFCLLIQLCIFIRIQFMIINTFSPPFIYFVHLTLNTQQIRQSLINLLAFN